MSKQMNWAQRWSVNEDGKMVMDDHGSWVENAYYEYLKADYARLKADAQLVVKHLGEACADSLRLKAEVERLRASSFVTAVPVEQYERVIKAGDAVCESPYLWEDDPAVIAWRAAKEGKPSV